MATPSHRAMLAAPTGSVKLWLTSVGPDQMPVAMWAAADGAILLTAHDGDGAIVRETRTQSPGLQSLDHLQPLPDGQWVMADARAPWSMVDGVTRNAVLVGLDGAHVSRECLGDAIEHLVVSGSGAVWTAYWDEATTGESQAALIGASGLVRWAGDLRQEWTYDGADTGSWILTCDALTLDGERAVAAIDPVRKDEADDRTRVVVVDGDTVRDYATSGVTQAWGVLASGDTVALLGSGEDELVVTTGRLGDGVLHDVRTTRVDVDPDTLTARVCRGGTLHLFQADRWSTVTLAALLAADG